MNGPTFTKYYTNKRQSLYDAASTSGNFDLASYNNAEAEMGAEQADLYAHFVLKSNESFSPSFNEDRYKLAAGDYNLQMQYLYNEFIQDRSETDANGNNVYEATNEYLNSVFDQKERQQWYDELNVFDKFMVNFNTILGDIGNTFRGIFDKVGDAIVLLGTTSADLMTYFQFHDTISDAAKSVISTDWTFTERMANELNDIKSVSWVGKNSFGKIINEVTTGIANMLPILIPGVGQVGQVIYGASMLGGAAGEAVNKNPDIDLFNLAAYSALVTGVEYGTELLSSKIFKGSDYIGAKMMGLPIRQATNLASYLGLEFASEAFEEGVSEIADSLLDVLLVQGADSKIASLGEVLHAALIGGVTSLIVSTVGLGTTPIMAINTKTNQVVDYYEALSNGVDEENLKKLGVLQSLNLRESLGQATEAMRTDALEDFYTKYKREDANLTNEKIRELHPEEFEKARKQTEESAKTIADAAAILTKTLEWAGADGFVKANEILNETREKQARLIRNFTEKRETDNVKYRTLEKAMNNKYPNTSFSVTEDLTAAQLRLQDTFREEYGIDLIFGDYGNSKGDIQNTNFALNENTVVLDTEYYKDGGSREIAEKYAKASLVEALQLRSGVLNAENVKNLTKILNTTKHMNYNASTIEDSEQLKNNVEELKTTDVDKLSASELKKYADLQKNTLAQLLLFDELTASKVFIGSPKTFKQTWQWLKKQGNFFKNAIKTPLNKIQYNYVLKAQKMYENVVAKTSPNLNYMRDAAKDLGASDEEIVRMERLYDPTTKSKEFEHWAYLPLTENTSREEYLLVSNTINGMTAGKFTFENAFNPEIYQDEVLRSLWLVDTTQGKTFKYNLQNHLINNYGFVIDDVHKQFVRVTPFNEHTNLDWTATLLNMRDGEASIYDLMEFRTIGSIFGDDFNNNVYNRETGETLYNYKLNFIPVNRREFKNSWGRTDFTNKTIDIFIDPNAKNLINELAQVEHTIYHETQHIIANWTNMYQGGDVGVISKAMRLEPKQDKIKTLYETLNDDTFEGSDNQYDELAVQIYALLGGEWLAESERLKFNPVNVKRVYDKSTVFGQTDYLDITYTPQGSGMKMTLKGYGFYSNIKIDLFTTQQTSLTAQRTYTNEVSDVKGNVTEEFKELQTKQRWTTEAKRLIDKTSDDYVTGIGDVSVTNEVISKLYPNNKYATTIEYVDQVINDIPYLLWYKKINTKANRSEVLDMNEVRKVVNDDLMKDKKRQEEFNNKMNQVADHVQRHVILNADFDYSLNSVAKVEANTNLTESHRGQRAMEKQMTVTDRSESQEEAEYASQESEQPFETSDAKYTAIDTALEQINKQLDSKEGFAYINNMYKYIKEQGDPETLKYLQQQMLKQNILSKTQYEKQIAKLRETLNGFTTKSQEELDILNQDVSKFETPLEYQSYVDDLQELIKRHKEESVVTKKPTVEKGVKDEFRRVQEESRREVADAGWGSKSKEINDDVRTRLSRVLGEKINSDRSSYSDNSRLLKLTGKENTFEVYEDINPNTFHDCFEITRAYLSYGELVDLHDVKTTEEHDIGYEKCECYLSKDGLSGFAITPDGDLISVFNANEKRGFLRAIAPIITKKVKTLDCYISYKQNLQDMYSKLFGFKTASVMNHNMKYDHDQIAATHNRPKVAFMVNTNADVLTKRFTKDQYAEAQAYQQSYVKGEQPVVEKTQSEETTPKIVQKATSKKPTTIGDAIVSLVQSEEVELTMSQVQDVGENNKEVVKVTKDIWNNHAELFTGINDSNYEEIRNQIVKSGNQIALITFDYYCRRYKGRFNTDVIQQIDSNARESLTNAGKLLATQSQVLDANKPLTDLVSSLGADGYKVDVDDSVIAEYDERLANKEKHITELESRIKELENELLNNKELNAIEKANLNAELEKLSEEKYLFQNGSNIELMDWLLNNVDLPTIAEVFAKQTQIQKSFIDKLITMAEKADVEGGAIGFYIRNAKGEDVKAFPKTREFLGKWLKKARSYRMWAMLSSPTTWVRNWVGNTGMRSLDSVTNAFERMLSRRFFNDVDYEQSMKLVESNRTKISDLYKQLTKFNEDSKEYDTVKNQIAKLEQDTHKLEFDMGQLKYQETKAGKDVYNYIADNYGDYILQNLVRKQSSKYDETGGKSGELKRVERAIEYESANTIQKLMLKSQDITQWGLSTGILGDEPMVKRTIIKNMGNLVASNVDYLLAGIRIERDALNKKSNKSKNDTARLNVLNTALETKAVTDIFKAMNEAETTRLFENAMHRAEEQYFKNGNWLSRKLSEFGSKHPAVAEIISWVMPFPKVAANILTMAYKYSPAGFISTLVQWSKYKQKQSVNYTGQITGFEKADILRSASQATTGTFLLIAGALAAALGWIDIDDDDYLGPAIKVGDFMRILLSDLAPSMTTFSTAAALMYSWKNHKSGVEAALNNLYDNTLLGNIDNIFKYGGLTSFAETVPVSLVSQYVPAVLKLVNNTVFQSAQKDKSGNILEKMWKTLAASVPGLSSTVADKINPYTGDKSYSSGTQNWFLNFLAKASPITVKYTYGQSDLEKEAARLNTNTTGLSGSFKINGVDYKITGSEKMELAKYRANYIENEFNQIYSDKKLVTVKDSKTNKFITTKYSKLTDEQKQNVLTNIYSKASTASKVEYWTNNMSKRYISTNSDEYKLLKQNVSNPSKVILNINWTGSKFSER